MDSADRLGGQAWRTDLADKKDRLGGQEASPHPVRDKRNERAENHGLDVIGAFHSDTWGDFRTYFRFQLSPAGKIERLDIGQAK